MILWLSSYPKSGNTWIRALLSNYFSNNPNNIFSEIKKISKFPSEKYFQGLVDINELKKDPLKIFKHFITAQERINLNKELNIIKTHNFAGSIGSHPFSDLNNTSGFIYVVRDPRSVVVSYAHHANITYEKSVEWILNSKRLAINHGYPEARLTWKIHIQSWLNSSWPRIIVKYENLHKEPNENFKSILNFIGKFKTIEINEEKIKKTIEMCNFKNLSNLENKEGFFEKVGKENFFRKGEVDEWKKVLSKNIIKKIEDSFNEEMKILGYLN